MSAPSGTLPETIPQTMRAMVLHAWGGPFELEQLPVPQPTDGDVLVRVAATGAGLTLEHVRAGRLGGEVPRIMGHELGGTVAALGAGVTGWQTGDRVTASFNLYCGHCRWCSGGREQLCENFAGFLGAARDGAFAEYVTVPARNLVRVPDGLALGVAGVASDALATPYHAARERARIVPGQTVGVIGAGGGIGVHMVSMARAFGARVVAVDTSAVKMKTLADLEIADVVVTVDEGTTGADLRAAAGGPLDAVIDFVSLPDTVAMGLDALGTGGTLVIAGAGRNSGGTFVATDFISNEKSILGTRNTSRAEISASLDLLVQEKVAVYLGATFPLEKLNDAFDAIRTNAVFGRIVIDINDEE